MRHVGNTEIRLSEGWNLILTEANAYSLPSEVSTSLPSVPAPVPGTVASALEKAGQFERERPYPLNTKDAWYFCRFIDQRPGDAILRLEGLATLCDVFLNGEIILTSESMFVAHEVDVHLLDGDDIALCFRALQPRLDQPGPRARWRPQMITPQGLRTVRTSLLGYMPGWCPEIHPVGPWRPISIIRRAAPAIRDVSIRATLAEQGEGKLSVSFSTGSPVDSMQLRCGEVTQNVEKVGDDSYSAILKLPDVQPWWPHTHGAPVLHEIVLVIDGTEHSLGRTGFRRISIDRGSDGEDFAVLINGERVFCRGAVWTTADIVALPGEHADYEPWLRLAVDAGMNMIRIGGTMAYETPDFFRLCDELGLLVWQDFMFANFDYPKTDQAFLDLVGREVEQFVSGVQASPSLTVLCGGSEIYQQAAMLGLPKQYWTAPVTDDVIPEIVARLRPDVPYISNSPCGGAMPFSPNAGVAHYYGVGAYQRPLEDARRANVRFAAESLAFSHIPQSQSLQNGVSLHSPQWKERVPRDRGVSWDFEDVRDHYLQMIYGVDATALRRQSPADYLDFSRAVTGEVLEETYAEWRRAGSSCNGALVWTLQDLLPGAGWGVIDSTRRPKPVWYAMRRAFRPVQVLLLDEGTNGLDVHVINESSLALDLDLEVTCLRNGQQQVTNGRHELSLIPRAKERIACTDLFGAFFDTTYSFRFGPPSHEVTVARLRLRDSGELLAEAFHFPLGRSKAIYPAAIESSLMKDESGWVLDLKTDRFAQAVHVDVQGFRSDDDWFHLAPGTAKRIRLIPEDADKDVLPSGEIRSLGNSIVARF